VAYEAIRYEVEGPVARLTIDREARRNALSDRVVAELRAALAAAREDRAVRVVVVTGAGERAFCAGADLKERRTGPPDSRPMVSVLQRLMDAEVPTIAAVKGPARAGGIGLMAACDLVVVEESITFAMTEVRIGVAAAIISVPILRRASGSRLAAAFLTAEPFDARFARDVGLVTHVVPADAVDDTVAALCTGIKAGAPRAVSETKRLLREVPTLDTATAFERMRALSDELFAGPDAAEGMAAFAEKRSPTWA
jgi:methylglutaconyl-CoA hydratase